MIECNCGDSKPVETQEHVVCSNCGVILDKLYEKELSHKQVSHLANPIIGDIHPTINRTLSELSAIIDMQTKTRLDIIDRAYQLYDSTINYVIATKIAFMEQFPDIDLDLNKKTMKKVEIIKQNHSECDDDCMKGCRNFYSNRYIPKRIKQIKILIKNGKKKGMTTKQVLKHAKFSRNSYYRFKDTKPKHVHRKPLKYKTITERARKHIIEYKKMKEKTKEKTEILVLQSNLASKFNVVVNISTIYREFNRIHPKDEEFIYAKEKTIKELIKKYKKNKEKIKYVQN